MIQLFDAKKNDTICQEGEEGDLFYIILRGSVEILKSNPIPVEYPIDSDKSDMDVKVNAYSKMFKSHY